MIKHLKNLMIKFNHMNKFEQNYDYKTFDEN